jgi:hypothetical protein
VSQLGLAVTAVDVLAVVFVAVSLISLAIQLCALRALLRWPRTRTDGQSRIHRGLLRTSVSRVAAAVAYVITGSVILASRDTLPLLSLSTFSAVQALWIGNSVADVRLRRRISDEAVASSGEDE